MAAVKVGGISLPMTGETTCGDAYYVDKSPDRTLLIALDSVGHGHIAAQTTLKTLCFLDQVTSLPLTDIVARTHEHLLGTPGVVMGLLSVDLPQQRLSYLGVGNIGIKSLNDWRMNLIPQNGTIGYRLPSPLRETTMPYREGDLLVMYSDGVHGDFMLSSFPAAVLQAPQALAESIAAQFSTGLDDFVVAALRIETDGT